MFNIFKKDRQKGKVVVLKIRGMHCVSCSMNIDDALEELDGVISSKTSYAKRETRVEYNPEKISEGKIKAVVKDLGYFFK